MIRIALKPFIRLMWKPALIYGLLYSLNFVVAILFMSVLFKNYGIATTQDISERLSAIDLTVIAFLYLIIYLLGIIFTLSATYLFMGAYFLSKKYFRLLIVLIGVCFFSIWLNIYDCAPMDYIKNLPLMAEWVCRFLFAFVYVVPWVAFFGLAQAVVLFVVADGVIDLSNNSISQE
jgi:hypothetical protein